MNEDFKRTIYQILKIDFCKCMLFDFNILFGIRKKQKQSITI